MDFYIKSFSELNTNELYQILQLRAEVFVVEQDCVYQDLDGKDQKSLHVFGTKNNKIIAYTRIFKPGDYFKNASIGRVVVVASERKFGFGHDVMKASILAIKNYFKTIGIIRGDELGKDFAKTLATNSTLKQASEHGMKFEFISREYYREKTRPQFIETLQEKHGDFYSIPEGGTNELAIKGCEEILTTEDSQFDYICSCVGTGGTISGIINKAKDHQKVIGFPALKGDFLENEILKKKKKQENWELIKEYHFGGYGKYTDELIHFINRFKSETDIPLDPIYTGKMMFGIVDMIKKNRFLNGSKILIIHSGGLQGIEGFNQRLISKQSGLKIL